jgi:hypothetical protein
VLVNDIPAAFASYYLSPNVDEIELLNFGNSIRSLVSDWTASEVQQVHDQLNVPDEYEWPAQPHLEEEALGDELDIEPPEEEPLIASPELAATAHHNSASPLANELSADEEAAGPSTVDIETESGSRVRLDSDRSVLLQRERGGQTDYVWTSAVHLSEGDQFIVIPEDARRALYNEALLELYEEELSDLEYMDSLELWWRTMREIYDEYENIEIIYSLLDRREFDKSEATVKDWFRAVRAARKPLDLVEHPSLTIGPDSASDIQTIGDVFDRDELVQHAGLIQNVMERFRKENRQKGRELNEEIIKMIEDPDSDISAAVSHRVVDLDYE